MPGRLRVWLLPADVCLVRLVARYWTSEAGRFDAWTGRLVPLPQAPRVALDPVTYAPTEGLRAAPGPAVPAPHPALPPHLPAPQPQPSPDHRQVHLTQAEWQQLIKGRWDRKNNKKLLQAHRQTEFQVEGTTYRTDAKGKVVAVFDARKSFNVTGARKGFPGIPLTLTGEPTFVGTPHMFPVTDPQKNVVTVDMVGNRPGDFKAANEAAGLADVVKAQGLKGNKAPKGYTWHHRDDFKPNPSPPPLGTCTMELVSAKAHRRTFVHYGACDQCNKHVGKKLYT